MTNIALPAPLSAPRHDVDNLIFHLPARVRDALIEHGPALFLAGGYLRRLIVQFDRPRDIDLFVSGPEMARPIALAMACSLTTVSETENAFTLTCPGRDTIQVIHRWSYQRPEDVIDSFDFTICQAVLWFEAGEWRSLQSSAFAADVRKRRLTYANPADGSLAGGSLLRAFRFASRGYEVSYEGLAHLVARVADEARTAKPHLPAAEAIHEVLTEAYGGTSVLVQRAGVSPPSSWFDNRLPF